PLLMQYAIATLVEPGDRVNPHEQILRIYDAFGIELLAGRQLRGRSAGQSLLESLQATGIVAERISRLSAFHELFNLLTTPAEKGRRTTPLRLVGDVDGIVTPKPREEDLTLWTDWLTRLRELVTSHSTDDAKKSPKTREPLDWLYDFDLLQQIT